MTAQRYFLLTSRGMRQHVFLPQLLDGEPVFGQRPPGNIPVDAVIAWGRKKSAATAERVAARQHLPLLRVEDGFLRSVAPGADDPGLSLVIDDLGIYYDASQPSRLEQLIARPLSPTDQARAQALILRWREQRVSKYNHAPEAAAPQQPYVLVVDQTWGDASIAFGGADERSFARMLQAALEENPDCRVLVKLHPEVMQGRKRGHFGRHTPEQDARIDLLGEDVHPCALLQQARAVYVVTSQLGFEALLWGRPVRTFGLPFYAGWGLTHDELPAPTRRSPASLQQLAHAALIAYARYVHPELAAPCPVEDLIDWLGLQRRQRHAWGSPLYACGFSRWKRPIVRSYLQGSQVHFLRSQSRIPAGATRVLWGRREAEGPGPVLRIEDGFLRSVGLGADLTRPLSWVIDDVGIYYDASAPSRLENILQQVQLDAAAEARVRDLRAAIIASGITKYNVGTGHWQRPAAAGRVILVPGQVESDLSIRFGTTGIRRNAELLAAVRQANPGAWIVYKPHPDVLAGLREKDEQARRLPELCDEIVTDAPMHSLLEQVDEVHVLTSLAGFEALLRGRRVVCYGAPFYAGWGLTEDIDRDAPVFARRQRRLSLEQLLAGTLIEYPRYISRRTGRFTTPERALQELVQWRQAGVQTPVWRRRWLRLWARLRGRA